MKKIGIVVVLIIFGHHFMACTKRALTCNDLKNKYLLLTAELHTHEDTIKLIRKIDGLLNKNPTCLKASQLKSFFLFTQSKFPQAKTQFLEALKLDSTSAYTLYYLAVLYNFENNNDSAFYLLNKAINIKNKNGYVIDNNNLFSENLDVNYDELIHYRGIIFFESSYFQLAKADFLNIISDQQENDDTYAYLAAIYSFENKLDSACIFHQKSIINGIDNVIDTSLIRRCGGNVSE